MGDVSHSDRIWRIDGKLALQPARRNNGGATGDGAGLFVAADRFDAIDPHDALDAMKAAVPPASRKSTQMRRAP